VAPVKRLLLLRHAKSSWDDPARDDHDRPLSARGRRDAEAIASYIRRHKLRPDLVLCSTARRARETLDIVHPALGEAAELRYLRGLYLRGSEGILAVLRNAAGTAAEVMVVGHNPDMQALALSLAAPGEGGALAKAQAKFPTAALAVLELHDVAWKDLGPGSCRLAQFVRPKDLR
jgi:phosphohistidine phosphatase